MQERNHSRTGNVVVIIPTLNRITSLINLLELIRKSEFLPICTIVVDASEDFSNISADFIDLRLQHVKSSIKSAAVQRNIGIQIALEKVSNFDFVSFLDDDIEISKNYFKVILERFNEEPKFVGISGIAVNDESRARKQNWLTNLVGLTGRPGSLTKALVNISPIGLRDFKEVDWLIGCSVWRREVIERIRFEVDFSGQSLFEDVIFSYRSRVMGKLGCDPKIEIKHLMSIQGRPGTQDHYTSWIINRFRLFSYSAGEFSRTVFWVLNCFLIAATLAKSPFSKEERLKCKGLCIGTYRTLKSRRNN